MLVSAYQDLAPGWALNLGQTWPAIALEGMRSHTLGLDGVGSDHLLAVIVHRKPAVGMTYALDLDGRLINVGAGFRLIVR